VNPHHLYEAERAQQESASDKTPFVNIWMHAGFLTINGAKMSKSLGNFMTIDDVLKKMSADEFRMMLFMHHYRQPIDFSEQTMRMAKDALHYFRVRIQSIKNGAKDESIEKEFQEAMDDDFNTPLAIATLRKSNDAGMIIKSLENIGININPKIPANVLQLVQNRELSRASKQFSESDALRAEIEQLGYVVEDTPAGPLVLLAENPKFEIRNPK
jgi:cysteinyl-tRNA synthetase